MGIECHFYKVKKVPEMNGDMAVRYYYVMDGDYFPSLSHEINGR